ncbi:MAG: alanine racemase [Actinomycetota bacterium]
MSTLATATVDLVAFSDNVATVQRCLTGGAQLCAVVKANAYGHQTLPCAKAALAAGATWLAVSSAAEAAYLRSNGIATPILVMGAISAEELTIALEAQADVVAWSEPFVEAIARTGLPARVHLKFDSGMGRFGTRDAQELARVAAAVTATAELELVAVMTHFATADDLEDPFFSEQLTRFTRLAKELKASYPEIFLHAANSAATLRQPDSHFDMVRCGIALYGMDPYGKDPYAHKLKPVLELHSYVASIKPTAAGESAGYGRRFVATEATNIATVPIGYGDGFRRALSNNSQVLIGGQRYRVVGSVSMDSITIDLGAQPTVTTGQRVTLIGRDGDQQILAEEMAQWLGSINYEVTTGLLPRIPRIELPSEEQR